MSRKREQPKSLEHKGTVYHVGDTVLLLNEADAKAPFICKIEQIVPKGKDVGMRVKWYYRPEETCSGRRAFHSAQEVMASDHVESLLQPPASIVSKCSIHTLEEYMAKTETFQPDQIAVYCKCQMPFNPDRHMVECPGCQSWFHPECLGYRSKEEFRRKFYSRPDSRFVCDDCQKLSESSPASVDEDHETSETIRF